MYSYMTNIIFGFTIELIIKSFVISEEMNKTILLKTMKTQLVYNLYSLLVH